MTQIVQVLGLLVELTTAAREASALVQSYSRRISQVSQIIANREEEGRDTWTQAELQIIEEELEAARLRAQHAIDEARSRRTIT